MNLDKNKTIISFVTLSIVVVIMIIFFNHFMTKMRIEKENTTEIVFEPCDKFYSHCNSNDFRRKEFIIEGYYKNDTLCSRTVELCKENEKCISVSDPWRKISITAVCVNESLNLS